MQKKAGVAGALLLLLFFPREVVLVPALSEASLPCPALPQPPYAFAGDSWTKLAKLPNVRRPRKGPTIRDFNSIENSMD